jgi:hypothetical protein
MSRALDARLAELQRRRALLVERADAQRIEMSAVCMEFERPLRWARASMGVVAFLRNSPGFAAFSTAASILIGSRLAGIRSWLARGLMFYQLGNAVRHRWQQHKEHQAEEQVGTAT